MDEAVVDKPLREHGRVLSDATQTRCMELGWEDVTTAATFVHELVRSVHSLLETSSAEQYQLVLEITKAAGERPPSAIRDKIVHDINSHLHTIGAYPPGTCTAHVGVCAAYQSLQEAITLLQGQVPRACVFSAPHGTRTRTRT